MIFLRKLLSTGNRLHQQFAVDMWCAWLDHRLPFNEQQEEEIVSALKNSVAACHAIQAWSFGRLEQVFQARGKSCTGSSLKRWANSSDEEEAALPRFRFSSLDAFYQRNSSLDGAASTGLVFQKLLSCLIQFEKAAWQSKRSSEGLPIEGLSENDSDIKQWLVDLVSNWKYFFYWICQDSDNLLSQSTQGRACDKSAWWKLVARIYVGCGICNIAIEMLLSVWSLMEVEFSLHRMVQKLTSHYANEMEASLSKEYVRAASYGLHRVLQREKLQLLTAIQSILQDTSASDSMQQRRLDGVSFDAVLFTLDACCSSLGDDDLFGAFYPREIEEDELSEAGRILEILLSVYVSVRDRIVIRFSLYAASISSKFPTSARHLVAPSKNARAFVLLETKGGEEMLEHVCSAIGRNPWLEGQGNAGVNNFGHLSRYFLSDVQKWVPLDGLTKLNLHALSSLAYDILCVNVVYNPRLLRLLMSICLPVPPALCIQTFKSRRNDGTQARRKRLRQDLSARSSYGLRVDSGSESDASCSSDSDGSRIPHLQSHACQSIAILAVLAVLEQSQATLLSAITAKTSSSEPCSFPHRQEILGYLRIHELVNKAISDDRDFSWGTRKVLLKILHMIELGLRIGKAIERGLKGSRMQVKTLERKQRCVLLLLR
ncbi:uncharacterized protein PITG_18034 [Phytophthora infestans T30-4]|uniref:Uncharacterized protein n=1 Tax=Phytophthora infestans (strain T30-4) TaxID=403677 RepID=D0NXK3_PHYIT|nr:uncharacterized protein PITG_18034 [Phytophthora infestans T30-4]EEY67803.1 conserved hypothetical protein [Phytophthora infestans T30-4]|eukprot:XP_002997965.1 conserved hypothetical protein [Phytophthora infestans T30-4]